MIDLRCCDVADMLASLPDGCASLVMADPPWVYANGGPPGQRRHTMGFASMFYNCADTPALAAIISDAYRCAAPDAYLGVWCTFPKLEEWYMTTIAPWQYTSGGAWGKTNGIGIGFHFRGDAELLLLYKKGNPHPRTTASNLWLSDRQSHSEKPQKALRALVEMACPPGGLVVDLYAGASASLAIACRSLGRRYVGAEIDPRRHELAMMRFSQQEMRFST